MMKYKNYVAKTSIDVKTGLIYGEVVGARDVITFEGESVVRAYQAFKESVDLYLKTCEKHGLTPEKPFNGMISYRTAPKTHRRLTQVASALGLSVNQYLDRLVRKSIRRRDNPSEGVKPGETAKDEATALAPSPVEPSPPAETREPLPPIDYHKPAVRRRIR